MSVLAVILTDSKAFSPQPFGGAKIDSWRAATEDFLWLLKATGVVWGPENCFQMPAVPSAFPSVYSPGDPQLPLSLSQDSTAAPGPWAVWGHDSFPYWAEMGEERKWQCWATTWSCLIQEHQLKAGGWNGQLWQGWEGKLCSWSVIKETQQVDTSQWPADLSFRWLKTPIWIKAETQTLGGRYLSVCSIHWPPAPWRSSPISSQTLLRHPHIVNSLSP